MLNRLFDNTKSNSPANKFRRRRFRFFLGLIREMQRPVNILDLGGTEIFWKMMDFHNPEQVNVTIFNTESITVTLPNFRSIKGDARDLSRFKEKQFDIVFSNSVIEHVGSYSDQKQMALEIIRTGKSYFVQTPNYYFPFEPHFMSPMFQFLPDSFKISLLTHFNLGWHSKCSSREKARELIDSVRLLKKQEITSLFPDSELYKEKFLFLTKSFTVYKLT